VKDVIDLAEKLVTLLEKFKVSEVYAIYIGYPLLVLSR